MERILHAAMDDDMYPNTLYDQSTAFYNLLMDGKETVEERHHSMILQLEGGVYDFYAGYADRANGSGVPRLIPFLFAEYLEIRGVDKAQTGDETVLRLHGDLNHLQWLYLRGCKQIKFVHLRIEYADESLFCPISNPHRPPVYPVYGPHFLDHETVVFESCSEICLENVKLYGKGLRMAFCGCDNITLQHVSGDGEIRLIDCFGFVGVSELNCRTEVVQREHTHTLTTVPQMQEMGSGMLCEGYIAPEGGDPYVKPIKTVTVTDIHTGAAVELDW